MRIKFSLGMPHCCTAARWGWLGKTGASAGVAQCGLCSAFPRVLQRTQRCECRVCQDGVQEPAAPSWCSGAAAPWLWQGRGHGCHPGLAQLQHQSEGTCAILPLLSRWLWLCPTPPSLGWGYSGTLLLLSSFSPAASRNAAVCAAAAAWGQAGPIPSSPAVPRRPCLSRRAVSSAPGARSLLLPRPHNKTPPPPSTRGWVLPGLGKSPTDVQQKNSKSWLFFGAQMWPEVVIIEGTQGRFGDQSRALCSRFVAVV